MDYRKRISPNLNAYLVYEVLIAEHEDDLRTYILEFTGNKMLTDQICRDAFVRAFFRLPQLKRKSSFKDWLRMIASQLAYDAMHRDTLKKPVKAKASAIGMLAIKGDPT